LGLRGRRSAGGRERQHAAAIVTRRGGGYSGQSAFLGTQEGDALLPLQQWYVGGQQRKPQVRAHEASLPPLPESMGVASGAAASLASVPPESALPESAVASPL